MLGWKGECGGDIFVIVNDVELFFFLFINVEYSFCFFEKIFFYYKF